MLKYEKKNMGFIAYITCKQGVSTSLLLKTPEVTGMRKQQHGGSKLSKETHQYVYIRLLIFYQ